MSAALKPCPFCSESRTIHEEGQHWIHAFKQWRTGTDTGFWAVACTSCGVQQCTVSYTSEEAAIEAWNTRATEPDFVLIPITPTEEQLQAIPDDYFYSLAEWRDMKWPRSFVKHKEAVYKAIVTQHKLETETNDQI